VALERTPFVSVIMPVRNEGEYIDTALRAVLEQDWPAEQMEVIVVDGASDDGTAERARQTAASFSGHEVVILSNRRHITPVSLNMGLKESRGEVIIRVDGHTEIEPGYLRRCCEVLEATGHENVGGSCTTVGETAAARAIAAAQSSQFGVGNVAFRVGRAEPGPVDTVPFGAWPRRVFDEVGWFDEELVRNQDDEHNFRIIQAGGTVWFDPAIRSRYFSRSSLRKLARQYFQYGSYKVRVMQKRGGVASPRHLVPAAFVAGVAASVLLAAATRRVRFATVVLGPYAVANAVASLRVSRADEVDAVTTSAAFAVLHTCYGAGTLHGLWRWRAHFRGGRSA
jgi:succinoglycan biosynthesis protein ExoA